MAWIGKNDRGTSVCQAPMTLGQEVTSLLERIRPAVEQDRRGAGRTAIPFLFELSPVPGEVPDELAHTLVVVGKDISERGIGFYHERPIPYRRGILTVDLPGDGPVQLEVDLLWCRFTSLGWYESGGRLLGVSSGAFPRSRAG
jgi:hypothetical protein